MANRYWVLGGNGYWNDTSNWSTTSGGASGASYPTSTDNAIFDSSLNSSPAIYVTINAYTTVYCADLDFTGYTGSVTLQMNSLTYLYVYGNVTLSNQLSMVNGGRLVLAGTAKTITSNGKSFSCLIDVNAGASYTLADAFSQTKNDATDGIAIYGSLNTAGYSASMDNATVYSGGTLTLSTSAVTIGASFSVRSGGVFNCGTSTITFSDSLSTSSIGASGVATTFYNVVFYGIRIEPTNLFGINTYNNLTILSQAITSKYNSVSVSQTQTINGTLTIQSTGTPENRILIQSSVEATQRTIYVNTFAAGAGNCDFKDIAITGPAAPISGTSFGDAKNNSGITFTAAKTVYWVGGTAAAYNTTTWATTSGGAGAAANYPLPQDTAVIDDSSGATGSTMSFYSKAINNYFYLTNITMTARTLPFNIAGTIYYFGNLTIAAAATTSSAVMYFYGRTTQQVTTNGKTFTSVYVGASTTLTMQDALTLQGLLYNYGTLTTNNYSVTQTSTLGGGYYGYSGSTFNIGTSICTFAGYGSVADSFLGKYYVFYAPQNSTITGSGTLSFTGSNASLGKVVKILGACSPITINQGGSGRLYMYAVNNNVTYQDITNTYAATGATSIYFLCSSSTEYLLKVNNFSLAGASGKLCTITNTIYSNRINIQKPSGAWYVGANSTNGGQVSGASFTAGSSTNYLSISKVNFTVAQNGFLAVM